jgi:hypothetical protein
MTQMQNQNMWERDERQPVVKKVMSCEKLFNREDILFHQSQKEFNSCDLWGGKFR